MTYYEGDKVVVKSHSEPRTVFTFMSYNNHGGVDLVGPQNQMYAYQAEDLMDPPESSELVQRQSVEVLKARIAKVIDEWSLE